MTKGDGIVEGAAQRLERVSPEDAAFLRKPRKLRGGPNPYLVVAVALGAGILLAKLIDWRGHAHPRD